MALREWLLPLLTQCLRCRVRDAFWRRNASQKQHSTSLKYFIWHEYFRLKAQANKLPVLSIQKLRRRCLNTARSVKYVIHSLVLLHTALYQIWSVNRAVRRARTVGFRDYGQSRVNILASYSDSWSVTVLLHGRLRASNGQYFFGIFLASCPNDMMSHSQNSFENHVIRFHIVNWNNIPPPGGGYPASAMIFGVLLKTMNGSLIDPWHYHWLLHYTIYYIIYYHRRVGVGASAMIGIPRLMASWVANSDCTSRHMPRH